MPQLIEPQPSPRRSDVASQGSPRGLRVRRRDERTEAVPRIVTLSREYGAGGEQIASAVAEALGFALWDERLAQRLAEREGVPEREVRAIDERERDLIDDVLATSLLGASLSGASYRAALVRLVRELSSRGAAVIVGRGAGFLVRPEDGLRVRVVCPLHERVRRVVRTEHLAPSDAERFVRAKDVERERFVRQLSGEDEASPMHYDVLVNTAELTPEQGARLVIDAYAVRFGRAHTPQVREARV